MRKEKEEYKMSAANEAPDNSGPRFKSSSKRRIYIVVGVVCLLIVVAVAIALGVYFGVRGCEMDKITLTVRSSDCNTPVADVIITSSAELTITGKEPGVYAGEVCGMPATLSLQKEGFEPLAATISSAVETVTLTCSEPNCTVQSASISVTSTCATSSVEGVVIRGQNVIDVTSSPLGLYQMKVCSLPTLVNLERIGYAPQETTINDGSTVTLLCDSPVIIQEPQTKYRREGESVTLCCQTEPATGVALKWYKDGIELAGKTNNELSLTSLRAADQGLYQCSAKLTADPSLPAVRSREAVLTIRAAASSDCSDAWRPNVVEVLPGCYFDVGQCLKRPCRSSGSTEACSDNNVCCEVTGTAYPDCSMGKTVTRVRSCSCRCPAPSVVEIRGSVYESNTDIPLTDIAVTIAGTTFNTTTNASGEFSFDSVSPSRKRLVVKASDEAGTYLDNFVVTVISGSEFFDEVIVNIAMIRKAPLVEIDPKIENKLSISGKPLVPESGSTYLKFPTNAFYSLDGTPYSGPVYVSLTFIDPSVSLEEAPGDFVTLGPDGLSEILVTLGVFAIELKDDSGQQLLLKNNSEVFAKGPTPYLLWQLDEQTGTWVQIGSPARRKKRQETQEQRLASFTPQTGRWYNIDYKPNEPDCYFKVRVFHGNFSEENEVTRSRKVIPNVRQILAISDGNGVKYRHDESLMGCFRILCPADLAKASISVTHYSRNFDARFSSVNTLLVPATIGEYSAAIKSILQPNPYNYYTLPATGTNNLFVNTKMADTGPFYPNIESCNASTFDDPAFWFTVPPKFVEGDFSEGSEDRCVGKVRIGISSVMDPDLLDNLKSADVKVHAMSVWSDRKFGIKVASSRVTHPATAPQIGDVYTISAVSCFEYRCSTPNDMTSVYLAISNTTLIRCNGNSISYTPILNSSLPERGYYFNGMSNVDEAVERCYQDYQEVYSESFAGWISCNQGSYS